MSIASQELSSGNNGHAYVRSDPHRDHVFRDLFTQPDAGVVALRDLP